MILNNKKLEEEKLKFIPLHPRQLKPHTEQEETGKQQLPVTLI